MPMLKISIVNPTAKTMIRTSISTKIPMTCAGAAGKNGWKELIYIFWRRRCPSTLDCVYYRESRCNERRIHPLYATNGKSSSHARTVFGRRLHKKLFSLFIIPGFFLLHLYYWLPTLTEWGLNVSIFYSAVSLLTNYRGCCEREVSRTSRSWAL